MKNCPNCNAYIPFKEKFKTFWLGYNSIECSSCGTKFEHSFRNRILGGIVAAFSPSIAYILMEFYRKDARSAILYSIVFTVVFGFALSMLMIYFFSFKRIAK